VTIFFSSVFSNIGKFDDYTPLTVTTLDQYTTEVQDFPYVGDREIPMVSHILLHFLIFPFFLFHFFLNYKFGSKSQDAIKSIFLVKETY